MTKKAKGRLTRRRRFRDLPMLSKRKRREEVAPLDVSMSTSQWIIDDPHPRLDPLSGWATEALRQRDEIFAAQALAGSLYTPDAARLFNAAADPQEPLTIAAFQRSIEEITAHALEAEYRAIRERLDAQLYQSMFGQPSPVPHYLGIDWGRDPDATALHFLQFPRVEPETEARARERARGLLKSLLTPAQWAEFDQSGAVSEQINGREFVLRPGGMIEVRSPRLAGEFWCVAPDDQEEWLPPEDKLIGQLLHLRAGPDELRRAANVFPGGPEGMGEAALR